MSHVFSVWAPAATRLDVDVRGATHSMRGLEGGWWRAEVTSARSGDEYAFRVDGGDPRPDPRSPSQPRGVHGPSQLIDHNDFAWSDAEWRGLPLRDAVIYEVHTGTFTPEGTFAGVATRLDHLRGLGVDAIELMPVAEFTGGRGWGYDSVDLYAPHHIYGGPDGLKRLVDACHARGFAVIVDVVYNHLGPEGNVLPEFGPYFTDRYATPWGAAVNYDGPDSDEVRAFVVDNALMWLRDYHCDGLRLDAVHAIVDVSATHILEEISGRVEALRDELGREMWVIAESDANDPRLVRDRALGGYALHAQWNDNFHHALHAMLTAERTGYYADYQGGPDVCTALCQAFVYTGQHSRFRRRRFGRSIGEMPLARFVGYAQNHDQVGNRAAGERLCHLVSRGRACIAAALTILAPSVPLLFQGEEWAASTPFQYFTDLGDPALRQAVSSGRRAEFRDFGWDPSAVPDPQNLATFQRSRLRWEELEHGEHRAMLAWYRALIAVRRATPGLSNLFPADVRATWDAERATLTYDAAGLLVVCNLGTSHGAVPAARGFELLVSSERVAAGDDGWTLPPETAAVWRDPAAQ